jgi:hypothetical protein
MHDAFRGTQQAKKFSEAVALPWVFVFVASLRVFINV